MRLQPTTPVLQLDGFPAAVGMGHIEAAIAAFVGIFLRIGNAPTYIAGTMRVRSKSNGNLCMGKALKQALCWVVVVDGLAQAGSGNFNATTCIVSAFRHLIPERSQVEIGRKSFIDKAHCQIGVGHDVEIERACTGAAPSTDVACPDLVDAEFMPNMQVSVVVDPSGTVAVDVRGRDILSARS